MPSCHWPGRTGAGLVAVEPLGRRARGERGAGQGPPVLLRRGNVEARTGVVDRDKVIFTWLTNSSIGVSLKGRVFLLDSYGHRAETVAGRTPFVVEDLVKLTTQPPIGN